MSTMERIWEKQSLPLSASPQRQSSGRTWFSERKVAVIRLLVILLLDLAALSVVIGTVRYYAVQHLGVEPSLVWIIPKVIIGSFCVLAPLFGWIADRKMGYYHTLLASLSLSTLGSGFVCYAVGQSSQSRETKLTWQAAYAIGLTCTTLGTAATKATLIPYTLEQLSDGTATHRSIAGLVSASFMVGISGPVTVGLITDFLWEKRQLSYLWISIISLASLLLSLFLLIAWKSKYRSHRFQSQIDYNPSLFNILATGCGCYISSDPPYYDRQELPIKSDEEERRDKREEHRRRLGVLIPFLSSLIIMETVYSQLRNAFVDQAVHMNLGFDHQRDPLDKNDTMLADYCANVSTHHALIPKGVMHSICSGTILLMIPVTWCIVPRLHAKWKRRLPTMLERILIGMVLGIVTCLLAVITEAIRLKAGDIHHICGNHKPEDSHIPVIVYSSVSVLIQIPQHITLGLSSALMLTGVSEFVLSRAPCEFRCTAYSCIFFVEGVGYYISIILLLVMKKFNCYYQTYYTSAQVNIRTMLRKESESKTWIFYTILTALMIGGTLAFWWVKYRHRDVLRKERDRIPTRLQLSS